MKAPLALRQRDRFVSLLLPWADVVRRDLPWRRTRDPWSILVSEVMLQQTQVDRVIPKWEAFLRRFPTVRDCANAEQSEVVRSWEGLGFHRRAIALHQSAKAIVDRFEGVVPVDRRDLLSLPGIGPYTSRALRVFAYEMDDAVLDTNVGRIIARAVVGATCRVGDAQQIADSLVPLGDGWRWNQAMLDLGAMVCTKQRPTCGRCPVLNACRWRLENGPEQTADPATGSGGVSKAQSKFEGSDRQGRGKILALLRAHTTVSLTDAGEATGWLDGARVARVVESLVSDGLCRRSGEGDLTL